MDKRELFQSMDSLMAYDLGATDSGIKDEDLRKRVMKHIDNLSEEEFRIVMSEYICSYFVNEEAVKNGYGIEDVVNFIRWLDLFMIQSVDEMKTE